MEMLNLEKPHDEADVPAVPTDGGAKGAGAATKSKPAEAPAKVDELPRWRVLLHNDDVNLMEYVVATIVALTPLGRFEATRRMLEAHQRGLSLLLVTHRERAELYRDQFRSKRLVVTIEPEA